MAAWTLIFVLICLLVIDFLGRLLVQQNCFKPAGLIAMFTLALSRGQVQLYDRKTSLQRFFISSATACGLILAISILLFQITKNESANFILIGILPILLLPLYHLLFGLLGTKLMPLMASIENFRFRGMLSLVIGANLCFMVLYNNISIITLSIHTVFILLALIDLFYLLAKLRSNITFYNINQEDIDSGPTAFFHYLNTILEFFFYCTLSSLVITNISSTSLIETSSSLLWPMAGALILIASAFLGQKLFLRSEGDLGLLFFERSIIPLSFLIFGMAFVIESHM